MLSDEQLAAIRAREQMASKGPWTVEPRDVKYYPNTINQPPVITPDLIATDGDNPFLGAYVIGPPEPSRGHYYVRDAVFMAEARQDVPDLLAHIAHLESVIRGYRDILRIKEPPKEGHV